MICNSIKKILNIINTNNIFEDNIKLLEKILYLKPDLDKITLDMAKGCIYISNYNSNSNEEYYKYKNSLVYIEYYNNGIIKTEKWLTDNKLHRNNEPAYIERYMDGIIKKQEWYNINKLYNLKDPTKIEYYNSGMIKIIEWYNMNYYEEYDNYGILISNCKCKNENGIIIIDLII